MGFVMSLLKIIAFYVSLKVSAGWFIWLTYSSIEVLESSIFSVVVLISKGLLMFGHQLIFTDKIELPGVSNAILEYLIMMIGWGNVVSRQ